MVIIEYLKFDKVGIEFSSIEIILLIPNYFNKLTIINTNNVY